LVFSTAVAGIELDHLLDDGFGLGRIVQLVGAVGRDQVVERQALQLGIVVDFLSGELVVVDRVGGAVGRAVRGVTPVDVGQQAAVGQPLGGRDGVVVVGRRVPQTAHVEHRRENKV